MIQSSVYARDGAYRSSHSMMHLLLGHSRVVQSSILNGFTSNSSPWHAQIFLLPRARFKEKNLTCGHVHKWEGNTKCVTRSRPEDRSMWFAEKFRFEYLGLYKSNVPLTRRVEQCRQENRRCRPCWWHRQYHSFAMFVAYSPRYESKTEGSIPRWTSRKLLKITLELLLQSSVHTQIFSINPKFIPHIQTIKCLNVTQPNENRRIGKGEANLNIFIRFHDLLDTC